MPKEISAGMIVYNPILKKFLLLEYSSHWGFVKGRIELGEDENKAAKRELKEETGIVEFKLLDDFKEKMGAFGFEVIREKYFSVEYNPFGMQQSLLNCILKKREVLYETLKGNKEYVKEFSKANLLFQNLFFKLSAPLFIISDAVESAFRKGATVEFVMKKK